MDVQGGSVLDAVGKGCRGWGSTYGLPMMGVAAGWEEAVD